MSVKLDIRLHDHLAPLSALSLGTSIKTIIALGWRHINTVLGSTAVIFAIMTGGLLLSLD